MMGRITAVTNQLFHWQNQKKKNNQKILTQKRPKKPVYSLSGALVHIFSLGFMLGSYGSLFSMQNLLFRVVGYRQKSSNVFCCV